MAKEASTKVTLNLAGFTALRKSPGIKAELKARAARIAAAAGVGHEVFVDDGKTRARASVVTTTAEAMLAEANDRNLTRSIDAGRG